MIDYTETQNTLDALCLMFPMLPKICIQKSMLFKGNNIKTEKQLIDYLIKICKN